MVQPLKKDLTPNGLNQEELYTFLANVTEVVNAMTSALAGDGLITSAAIALGSNKDDVANVAFSYQIGGVPYNKAAVTAGTAPGTTAIPQAKYGAVAFDIGTNGTVGAPANATGYDSAALAAAALPAPAADHARMGYVTVTKSDGAFTLGTTEFDAANVTAVFTQGPLVSALAGAAGTLALTAG
jgi:hypothetical protein